MNSRRSHAILYIEDEAAERNLVRASLSRARSDLRLTLPESREQLEEELWAGAYDLLVVPRQAFGIEGEKLQALAQAARAPAPLILLFTLAEEPRLVSALARGAAAYLLKTPHYLERLPLTIDRVLEAERNRHTYWRSEMERSQLLRQVVTTQGRLHTLSQRLLEAQELERRSLARELHDQIGQALTAVKINLQSLQRAAGRDTAARLDESINIVERSLDKVRNLSLELRPSLLDDLGLVSALRWYVDRQAQLGGFTIRFSAAPLSERPPAHVETICFRVAQEALTNIVRHAQAQQVDVTLRQQDNRLQLRIRDNGVGFDTRTAREAISRGENLGLLGMEERALLGHGRLDIDSQPQRGTTVRLDLPLQLAIGDNPPAP